MTLKRKIVFGSFLSFTIIAILVLAGYANYIQSIKEIRFLELADILTSKSLQLRRHEKNFFLYRDLKEISDVHAYIHDLKGILKEGRKSYGAEKLLSLEVNIKKYEAIFNRIETLLGNFHETLKELKPLLLKNPGIVQLVEATYLESPLINAEILKQFVPASESNAAIKRLHELNAEIMALRKSGEEILVISQALDKSAREKVERYISLSHIAAIFLFPLFLFVGLGISLIVSHDILSRLRILTEAVRKTGKGEFSSLAIPEKHDEVGELIKTFNKMEDDLIERENEIKNKNEELLRSRKLASLGTLASGVAHELNNPLNNVYLAAQTLSKQIDLETCPGIIGESIKDVFSQTLRMKRIVSDLLEYSKQKAPECESINVVSTLENLLDWMKTYGEMGNVQYKVTADRDIWIRADRGLMRQVFINLIGNALDAMTGHGKLDIIIDRVGTNVQIKVADTGKGIRSEAIPKIFDPFYTSKERGTGLGLAIVYSIIKRHDGKIEVTSEINKGTTFIITLPGE